jgi:hypothetical protein
MTATRGGPHRTSRMSLVSEETTRWTWAIVRGYRLEQLRRWLDKVVMDEVAHCLPSPLSSRRSGALPTTIPNGTPRGICRWNPHCIEPLTQRTLASCRNITVIRCRAGIEDDDTLVGNQLPCLTTDHPHGQRMTLGQGAEVYAHEDERCTCQLQLSHHLPHETGASGNAQDGQTIIDSTVAQIFITTTTPARYSATGGQRRSRSVCPRSRRT